ncbi:MAG: HNH endonuclease [Chloroflexi bacterium]|nr:HNH endonuclease [Chloroflexota bacterium]
MFDNWMQLSGDHLRPKNSGGKDSFDNIVTACLSCNSITSRMKFPPTVTREQIYEAKRARIEQRRKEYYKRWLDTVAPSYLERPVPRFEK